MNITPKRAAEVLSMAVTFNGCGRTTSDEMKEAVRVAIKALEEKDQQVNQPLGMADLRNMDNMSVYCLELNAYVRVVARKTGWITIHWPLLNEKECCKAHGLTLYRSRPEEVR